MQPFSRKIRLFALLLCVLLGVSSCTLFKSGKYAKAVELFDQQQYLEAQVWFLKMTEYEDAQKYLDYILAWNTSANEEYGTAAEMYAALGDFRDGAEQALVCRYACAEQLLANGQYDEAIAVFEALGDYRDAAERMAQAYYAKAEWLIAEGRLEEAIEVFAVIAGHADAAERIPVLHYDAALQKLAENDYESACTHFEAANGYQDSLVYLDAEKLFAESRYDDALKVYKAVKDVPGVELRIAMIKYAKADDWYAAGKIDLAVKTFREIEDYADSHERACQCYYELGEESCRQKKYQVAVSYFEHAQDYRDAVQRAKETSYLYAEELLAKNQCKEAAGYFVRAGDHLDAFHRAVDIKRTLVTKGKLITFETANELKDQQKATCYAVYLKYDPEEKKFRILLDVSVPAGYPVWAFNPPDGTLFMHRLGTTTGERQEIVAEIEAEKLSKGEAVTVNCVKSDKDRFFIFLSSSNFLLRTPVN